METKPELQHRVAEDGSVFAVADRELTNAEMFQDLTRSGPRAYPSPEPCANSSDIDVLAWS